MSWNSFHDRAEILRAGVDAVGRRIQRRVRASFAAPRPAPVATRPPVSFADRLRAALAA